MSRQKYYMTFKFVDTEKEAREFCVNTNMLATYYERKHYPAHYTPWDSMDGNEHKFVCFYWYRIA